VTLAYATILRARGNHRILKYGEEKFLEIALEMRNNKSMRKILKS
jgi:hypothetical protein